MVAEITDRFEAIEECYEFMLAYAAQGLSNDEGNESGRQLRTFLHRAVEAIGGLAENCATDTGTPRARHSSLLLQLIPETCSAGTNPRLS